MTRFFAFAGVLVIASCVPTDPFADLDALGPDAKAGARSEMFRKG